MKTKYLVTYKVEYDYCEYVTHEKYFATLAEAYIYYKLMVRKYLAKPDDYIGLCLIKFDEDDIVIAKLRPPYRHERYGE